MIPIARPQIGNRELDAAIEPLRSGWLMQGPRVAQFETAIAAYAGVEHAVAVSSGTAALHVALLAAGIGPGDTVAVPSFTFIACANAIALCGARPLFVDIDPATFNICPDDLRRRGKAATALLVVHQFGRACEVAEVCKELGLSTVIEDAACALGTRADDGRHVGAFGTAATLSFHPRKVLTTGEGGMVLTNSGDIAARARALRSHGGEGGGFASPGLNYRLTDIQAALGLAQLERLDEMLAARAQQALRYNRMLADAPSWLAPPPAPSASRHAWQSYVCLVAQDGPDRDTVLKQLEDKGVSARPGATACHTLGWCAPASELAAHDLPGAWAAHRRSLALPIFPGLTEADQEHVVSALATL